MPPRSFCARVNYDYSYDSCLRVWCSFLDPDFSAGRSHLWVWLTHKLHNDRGWNAHFSETHSLSYCLRGSIALAEAASESRFAKISFIIETIIAVFYGTTPLSMPSCPVQAHTRANIDSSSGETSFSWETFSSKTSWETSSWEIFSWEIASYESESERAYPGRTTSCNSGTPRSPCLASDCTCDGHRNSASDPVGSS